MINEDINATNKEAMQYDTVLCPVDLFRFFLRKNYEGIEINNEECDGLGKEFYKYLRALKLTEEQKENILPKNTFDVILNADHPLRTNGFPAAYVLHFAQFVEQQKEKALADGYEPNGA
jgi:hypothetical protein